LHARTAARGGSAEAPAALDHLDLVAVGVLHEEEARHLLLQIDLPDRARRQTGRIDALVLGVQVVDACLSQQSGNRVAQSSLDTSPGSNMVI
jgi:hypothetical protein